MSSLTKPVVILRRISLREYIAGFDKLDKNHDGYIDRYELYLLYYERYLLCYELYLLCERKKYKH